MTLEDLSKSYIKKAKVRLEMLEFLFQKKAYSDVVREGDIDFIPTEEYTEEDAKFAIDGAKFVMSLAERIIKI